MPVAESFTAFTPGPAMPVCIGAVTMDPGDQYVARDARDTQVRAFWRTHSLRVFWGWSAEYTGADPFQTPTSLYGSPDITAVVGGEITPTQPKDRVCLEEINATADEEDPDTNGSASLTMRLDNWGTNGDDFVFRVEIRLDSNPVGLTSLGLSVTSFQLPSDAWELIGTYTVTTLTEWTPIGSPLTLYVYAPIGMTDEWDITPAVGIGVQLEEWTFP